MKNILKMIEDKKGKRGAISVAALSVFGIIIVATAITLAIGAEILDDIQDEFTANTYAYNATESGLSGVDTFADWLDTVALVLVAVVIIGLLAYFGRAGGGRG